MHCGHTLNLFLAFDIIVNQVSYLVMTIKGEVKVMKEVEGKTTETIIKMMMVIMMMKINMMMRSIKLEILRRIMEILRY